MLVTFKRVLLGVSINVIMIVLVAYPLSKSEQVFPARKFYVAFMLCVMLFSGGMMPTYFIVAILTAGNICHICTVILTLYCVSSSQRAL